MNRAGLSKDLPVLKARGVPALQVRRCSRALGRGFYAGKASTSVARAATGFLAGIAPATSVLPGTGLLPDPNVLSSAGALFFLVCALLLLVHVLSDFVASGREWSRWRETPSCSETTNCIEHRILYRGTAQELSEHCTRVCHEFFARFYTFHSTDPSATVYHFFAKRGTLSLFALPWLKTGFVLLFLGFHFGLRTSPALFDRVLLWGGAGTLCLFWIPAVWILARAPYQKIWMSLREADGRVSLTLLCCSPSTQAELTNLAKTLRERLVHQPTNPTSRVFQQTGP